MRVCVGGDLENGRQGGGGCKDEKEETRKKAARQAAEHVPLCQRAFESAQASKVFSYGDFIQYLLNVVRSPSWVRPDSGSLAFSGSAIALNHFLMSKFQNVVS